MAILKILHYPHANLRIKAVPVVDIDAQIKQLCKDMLDTMYAAGGIGLAATQVDVQKRVVVMDLSAANLAGSANHSSAHMLEEGDIDFSKPLIVINPEVAVLDASLVAYEEGCLSVPGISAEVKRPAKVRLSALDLEGKKIGLVAEGLLATCIQHEIDHLDGKLFIDYLSKLKLNRIRKKILQD